MKEDIFVSVIVAVYNAEKYLKKTIESIIGQSLRNIELILVDDGSDDSSLRICRQYEALDDRIMVLVNPVKSDGAAEARNLGLKKACGKYIAVLDADDFFEPQMLETMYVVAERREADAVICDAYLYWEDMAIDTEPGWIFDKKKFLKEEVCYPLDISDCLFQITPGYAWNKLFLRELILKEDITFDSARFTDDMGFTYLALMCSKRIAAVPDRLVHYRWNHTGSQSDKMGEWPETGFFASWKLMQRMMEKGLYQDYKVTFCNMAIENAFSCLHRMTSFKSFSSMYHSLKDEYFEKMKLLDFPEMEINNVFFRECRKMIMDYSPEEYLIKLYQVRQSKERILLFENLPPGSRIAIYGGGDIGKRVFQRLYEEHVYCISTWVDKNYTRLGFPIDSPERLRDVTVDGIIIAVKSGNTYEEIKSELIKYGINERKIIWSSGL